MGDVHADLDQVIHLLAELMADKPQPDKNTKISQGMQRYWAKRKGEEVLESSVEAVLVEAVKARGGVAMKILPSVAGYPDRLVVMPEGRAFLVELKQVGENPTKVQRMWHDRLASKGHPVAVLRGADQVREWVSQL